MATRRVNLILSAEVRPPFKRVGMPDRAPQNIGCEHPEAVSTRRLGSPADVQQCVACGAEWSAGSPRNDTLVPAVLTGESGYYVPSNATHCRRCGDTNWDDDRLCITCTHGAFASQNPDGSWREDGPTNLRDLAYEPAGHVPTRYAFVDPSESGCFIPNAGTSEYLAELQEWANRHRLDSAG
jgi:hypothetical protein